MSTGYCYKSTSFKGKSWQELQIENYCLLLFTPIQPDNFARNPKNIPGTFLNTLLGKKNEQVIINLLINLNRPAHWQNYIYMVSIRIIVFG